MLRMGRPTVRNELTDDKGETLHRWVRRPQSAQMPAQRFRMILTSAEGRTDREVVAEVGHPVTVSKWRQRFSVHRLEGLSDAPRPGPARTIGDKVIEACWSTRWSRPEPPTPTGPPGAWPPSITSAIRPSPRSGRRSGSNRGASPSRQGSASRKWAQKHAARTTAWARRERRTAPLEPPGRDETGFIAICSGLSGRSAR